MAYELRDNSGSIWVNERKTADNHPDRTGSIMVAGTEYWINGWLKKTADGKPYLSLSVKPKAPKADEGASLGGPIKCDMDDEIPFSPEWR